MKNKNKIAFKCACVVAAVFMSSSCNDFLDRLPLDAVTPENYFTTEADLASYAINMYGLFPRHEGWGVGPILRGDDNTDNQAAVNASYERWVPGNKRVPQSGGGWSFNNIRQINYFFEQVLPKYEAGAITGTEKNIKQYIGEMYFIRAYEYFNKLKAYGDFPILTQTLPDKQEALTEASKRSPRNEVARFILKDLDTAIEMMDNSPVGKKNRLTRNAALLFKSRVALYEATWLKYHKGTARVPGGPNWPGATKDYNRGFSIDIDSEIAFFFTEAMNASKIVADAISLTQNTGETNPATAHNGWNPYFDMFNANSMEEFEEVLFWKAYSTAQNVNHAVSYYLIGGSAGSGITKNFVDGFLMQNGLPIYAPGSGYVGENTIEELKTDRDVRLQLFVCAPTDVRTLAAGTRLRTTIGNPGILSNPEVRDVTGYRPRKCLSYDPTMDLASGVTQTYGCIIFRAAEAYLNYIEASYEKNGSLDATAEQYWKQIRQRAKVSDDIANTNAATDLSKEDDWARYSGTTLIDVTLFNIRRERRNEFISENFRYDDLRRWRALDMVKDYHIEGFNLWGSSYATAYVKESGESLLIPEGESTQQANVSSSSKSQYLRPNQIIRTNNEVYNGYNWSTANYLEPIAYQHFLITAGSAGDVSQSPIYQNPQWPIEPNATATN